MRNKLKELYEKNLNYILIILYIIIPLISAVGYGAIGLQNKGILGGLANFLRGLGYSLWVVFVSSSAVYYLIINPIINPNDKDSQDVMAGCFLILAIAISIGIIWLLYNY